MTEGLPWEKGDLCLDLLACGHSHAEKNFQGTVCGEVFSCDSKGIFYLGEDLVFSQNLGFQAG